MTALHRIAAGLALLLSACAATPHREAPLLDDPALIVWLQGRADALAGADPVRVRVVDGPSVQAELEPDGHLRVWRGLLLRARDESEVTFVLAHEIAHRSLGHFAQRQAGDRWDPLQAEREADRTALDALRQMGLRAEAATALLSLVAAEAALSPGVDRTALAFVDERLDALWEAVAGAAAHPPRGGDPWRVLLDTRFEAWFAADPAARDPARSAMVRGHAGRPAPP